MKINEKPRFYIETNSAHPYYPLTHSPERDYGIYTIINNADKSDAIMDSVFYRTLLSCEENKNSFQTYLGSPGLAMNVLNDSVEKYIFCDIEDESLNAINKYSRKINLSDKVQTYKNDSVRIIDSLRGCLIFCVNSL